MNINGALKEIDVVKKQKIKEETNVLGNLMPQHLGYYRRTLRQSGL